MAAIELDRVTKVYRRHGRRRQFATLKSALLSGSLVKGLRPEEKFSALNGVSLSVPRGACFGVIGRNGSGKSTLLKLVAGITKPTSGDVRIQGRISALIELGAGFHPEISGRENVYINGIMLGLSRQEIAQRFDEIVDFAELEEFIDAPVKTYSSGMYMRLGFAVAVHVDPDILLVDEVLAVGDEGFSLKCLDKFAEFKRRGKTILLVTHGLGMVERFCDEAVWLDDGQKRALGDPKRIVQQYLSDVERAEDQLLAAVDAKAQQITAIQTSAEPVPDSSGELLGGGAGDTVSSESNVDRTDDDPPEDRMRRKIEPIGRKHMFTASEGRWGSGTVRIDQVTLEGGRGAVHVFHSGEPMTIRMEVSTDRAVDDFHFGISIFSTEGECCYGTNTFIEKFASEAFDGTGQVAFEIERLDLVEGTYKLDVAVHKRDGFSYDYHRLLYTFRVKSRIKDVGIYRPRHIWHFSKNLQFTRDRDDRDEDGQATQIVDPPSVDATVALPKA